MTLRTFWEEELAEQFGDFNFSLYLVIFRAEQWKKYPVQGINTNIHILTSVDKKTLMPKPGKAYTLTVVVKSISIAHPPT